MSTIAYVVMLLTTGATLGQACECLPPSPDINPEMQALFEEILDNWVRNEISEDEFKKEIAALQERAVRTSKDPGAALMEQFFAKFFAEAPTYTNEERPMGMIVILHALQPSRMAYLEALYPYLCLEDKNQLLWVQQFMPATYQWTAESELDLSPHGEIVRKGIEDGRVPVGLVCNMFEQHPRDALYVLSKVESDLTEAHAALGWMNPKELRDSEEIVPEAIRPLLSEKLKTLATSTKWWVRLWVVELLRQEPDLRNDEMWKRLQQDPCGVVGTRTTAPEKAPVVAPAFRWHEIKGLTEEEPS